MNKSVQTWWKRPSRLFEIGLPALALGIRLVYLIQARDNPFFYEPTMDPAFHLHWARGILAGNFWGAEVFFRAPFYPYLLALFHAVTGGDLFWVRFLQHLIGAISVWGIYRLARTVVSEGAAKVAGLAAAIYATSIYFENELLLDFLLIPWMLLIFYAARRASKTQQTRWIFITGLVIGLFAITRPNILLCLPVFGTWVWLHCAKKQSSGSRAGKVILLVLGTLLPILPITVRNAVVGKDLVLISSQGGINFYIGNNAEADGVSAAMPRPWGHTWRIADVQRYAEEQVQHKLKPSELSNFWLREGLKWWGDQPGAALKLTFKKVVLLFSNAEIANNQDIRFFWNSYTSITKFLFLPFGIVAPFGLLGLILARRGDATAKLMLWVMLFYALSVIIFFVPARFRLPFLPLLFVGFGAFVELMYHRLQERQPRRIAAVAIPAVLLLVLSFAPWYKTQPATDAQSLFQLGNAALREQRLDEAGNYFRQTLLAHPDYENAHLNLGVVMLRKGLLEQAEEEFHAELAAYPQSGKAYANLSTVRELQDRWREAEDFARQALQLEPNNPTAILNLGRIYWATDRPQQAIELLESAPETVRDSPAGRDQLGAAYLKLRRYAEAEPILRSLAEGPIRDDQSADYDDEVRDFADELGYTLRYTHKARACYNLGWMLARQGNLDEALKYFKVAIALKPGFAEAHANLGAAYISLNRPDTALECFLAAVETEPGVPGHVYNVGVARLRMGDTAAALTEFERALEIDPYFTRARQKLEILRKSPNE